MFGGKEAILLHFCPRQCLTGELNAVCNLVLFPPALAVLLWCLWDCVLDSHIKLQLLHHATSGSSQNDLLGRWLCSLISHKATASPYLISGSFHVFHPLPPLGHRAFLLFFPQFVLLFGAFPFECYHNPIWGILPRCLNSISICGITVLS